MEDNTYETCLATTLDLLEEKMKHCSYKHLAGPIKMISMELEFLKMFWRGLGYRKESDNDWHLRYAIDTLVAKLRLIDEEFVADCKTGSILFVLMLDLEAVMLDLEEKIDQQLIRPQAKDICILLLGGDFKCTSCPCSRKKFCKYVEDTTSFMALIRENLKALHDSNLIAPVMKQQIALVQRGLEDFNMLVDPLNKLFDLIPRTRAWLNRISCLTYLYWIDGSDEKLASSMMTMLSAILLQDIRPCTISGVISPFFQPTIVHQVIVGHANFLLDDLIISLEDGIEVLHVGLIFLLSFIMDPSRDDSDDAEMIWLQSYTIMNKFPSLVYSVPSDKGGSHKEIFSNFLLDIDVIKEKVRNVCFAIPYSSHRSPSTNVLGFLERLIENLKKMLQDEWNLIPPYLHLGGLLLTELKLLAPLLNTVMEVFDTDEYGKIQDLWRDSIDMVYSAYYIINLCHLKNMNAWYGIIALPDVIKHVRKLKIEINREVVVEEVYNKKMIGPQDWMERGEFLQRRSMRSGMDGDSMGFIEDHKVIVNELMGGQKYLTTISISGSGGQGKSTLAKRIYNDLNVQCRFQKSVWCYVSKDCPVKELLVQFLSADDDAKKLGTQDLIEHVRKTLKGRRYLIVMDDIWDIDAWEKLESSFPDDKNGSRILFTSRNHDLVSQVKLKWISHPLPLFSDEECWELMKKRVFGSAYCDEEFVEIGKKIASYCKGLPLAVALTAAVLGKTIPNLDLWNRVAENLKVHLAEGGCGKVMELSYKHLPDYLKSCFLYFGAFKRGEDVSAKKLKLLWIGEGFIFPDRKKQLSDIDLATMYLNVLVSHSLVTVTEMNSMGEINSCHVHDLLYDLCLEKCNEENFINWVEEGSFNVDGCRYINHHRVRVNRGPIDPFIRSGPIFTERKLPITPVHSLLSPYELHESIERHLHLLKCFKFLTVLNLEFEFSVDEFPEEITSIIHLTYLAVRFSTKISAFPSTMAKLWMLRTVLIGTDGLALVPVSMWSMKSLRHVAIESARLDLEGMDQENTGNFLGGGSNIETLGLIYLNEVDSTTTAALFRHFPNLRKLSCEIDRGTGPLLRLFYLVGSLLTKLESLTVKCDQYFKLFYLIGSLLTRLESLKIDYSGSGGIFELYENASVWNFPKMENIKKLSLEGTRLPWSAVSEIGKKLPNLHALILLRRSCARVSWKLEGGDFSNLKFLKLSQVWDIEEIDVSNCDDNLPFPCLEHLVLDRCNELKEIPSIFEDINTLKTIKVYGCLKEVNISAMRIGEHQREFGNDDIRVIINGIAVGEEDDKDDDSSNY